MSRSIDEDSVINEISRFIGYLDDDMILQLQIAIKRLPAIDTVPVKHGHWIDMGDFEQCSACKATHLKEFNSFYGKVTRIRTAYCPHCGAKMDEVTE